MGFPSIGGGFDGGSGAYTGGSAKTGDLYSTMNNRSGAFSINAAPAWAGGISSGGTAGGIDMKTVLIAGAAGVLVWALIRKK